MAAPQLFRDLIPTVTTTASETPVVLATRASCTTFSLPVGGVLSLANGDVVTLTAGALFKPTCTLVAAPAIIANGGGSVTIADTVQPDSGSLSTPDGIVFSDILDPFYASTFPQCYALAATTVVAYTLVIMLFITPRSFLDGGVVVLGRKGFTSGTGTSIGGRPWLQKVAALTVAISLTIATAGTFRAAEEQYHANIQNAKLLQEDVLGGNEIKIIRIISNTFLWLAQAQTLIRLFPRQREKVIIKWTAFALITLDVIFQSLNSFQYTTQGQTRPRSFTEAVPALSYLFALALGVLYAAWVIYYALMKKRYAFYHPLMKNMCLVAMLSLLAILVPVVFFILDISKPEFTGWGEYVRWVGAAAASVIVWEWVERIEALEREEKKDGILGREVFDGDEMLDLTPADFTGSRPMRKELDDLDEEAGGNGRRNDQGGRGNIWPTVTSITSRYRSRARYRGAGRSGGNANNQLSNHDRIRGLQPPLWPARPPPAVTPISRTDSASAVSTVYAIRYHPLTETTSRTTPPPQQDSNPLSRSASSASSRHSDDGSTSPAPEPATQSIKADLVPKETTPTGRRWFSLARGLPLPRVRRGDEEERVPAQEKIPAEDANKWDFRDRLEEFAVSQAEKLREKFRSTPDTDSLPVTVIPAPPRRGAALAQLMEEEEPEPQRSPSHGTLDRSNNNSGVPPPTSVFVDESSSTLLNNPVGATISRSHLPPSVTQGSVTNRHRAPSAASVPPRQDSSRQPESILGQQPLGDNTAP
ncbi:pH-response regulator protein palH/rim-21 [Podospora didyma]|uniref:PH-response regulator protein palH/rim-21 n=1 Tax=Podospora didyma TaxID=330526 RepID=A0AAE0KF17_9PEZI|nr:pH-response regulator protein palH/rim-21 [Podospora didyma]